jgi:hypothetical protein
MEGELCQESRGLKEVVTVTTLAAVEIAERLQSSR